MAAFFRFFMRGYEWFVRQLSVLAGLALVLMMLHVMADVLMKALFNIPIAGTPEVVAFYYMVAAVFLPLAYVELKGKHITVDLLYNHMPPLMKRCCVGVACLASALFFALLTYRTWMDAMQAVRIGQVAMGSVALPIWPSRLVLPLGFGVITLTSIVRLISEVILQRPPFVDDDDEIEDLDVMTGAGGGRG